MSQWGKVKKWPKTGWSRIKQWFGIGGVRFALQVAPSSSKRSGVIQGKLRVSSKTSQVLKGLQLKLEENWQRGGGEEKTRKTFQLGVLALPGFSVQAGETKTLEFALPFQLIKSPEESSRNKPAPRGMLEKLSSFVSAERSDYFLVVSGDVLGTAFGPLIRKPLRLTD